MVFDLPHITKLRDDHFIEVLNNIEKFSLSVIFQSDERRKTKFFEMQERILKYQESKDSMDNLSETTYNQSYEPVVKSKKIKIQPVLPNELWLKILNYLNTDDIFQNFAPSMR